MERQHAAGAFWALNIGLALMALLTLLPMGVLQLQAALEHGYWYARSAEFMGKPIIDVLVWMRVPGDTVLASVRCSRLVRVPPVGGAARGVAPRRSCEAP